MTGWAARGWFFEFGVSVSALPVIEAVQGHCKQQSQPGRARRGQDSDVGLSRASEGIGRRRHRSGPI